MTTAATSRFSAAPRSITLGYSVLAFFVLAANLRPALTSVGPLLEMIRSGLGLSGTAAGLLPTLPLLVFAAFSPFGALGRIFGIERTLAGCLVLIVAGIILRSQGSVAALFGGTVVFAIGVGIANVLMPSLIKRDFPHRVGSMTTAYVMVMTLTGAVATGLSVPLAGHAAGGWRFSLAVWSAFAVLALVCWLPQIRKTDAPIAARTLHGSATEPIWRSAVAWQVTIFMGLQFLIFYVTISLVPLFLVEHGHSAAAAGWLLTLYQVTSFAVGVIAPALMRSGRDQRALAVAASLVTALSVVGLLGAPRLAGLWLFVCGASFGITFILAFALIGMRTNDHQRAASLSTMSQATAYLIAAAGPVAFGWLHDHASGWTLPMLSLLAIALIQAAAGFGAGRRGLA
jgi:MFS transporter, CP family, cyanate transporter